MPRLPIDYSKSLIYKIVCKNLEIKDFYVGSTTNVKERRARHKSECKNPNSKGHHIKLYTFIRANGDWENWDLVVIEKFPCPGSDELRAREQYHKEILKPSLNSVIASVVMLTDSGELVPARPPTGLIHLRPPGHGRGFYIEDYLGEEIYDLIFSYVGSKPIPAPPNTITSMRLCLPGYQRGFYIETYLKKEIYDLIFSYIR